MFRPPSRYSWLVIAVLSSSSLVVAHHGTAASYDPNKVLTFTGVVTEFVWANPHARVFFDVKDEHGTVVRWGGELHGTQNLSRLGWTRTSLRPGDQITVTLNPARAGTPFGVILTLKSPNGTQLSRFTAGA